jgi:hypothetical protein
MYWSECVYGFQFNNYQVLYQRVHPTSEIKLYVALHNRKSDLLGRLDSSRI